MGSSSEKDELTIKDKNAKLLLATTKITEYLRQRRQTTTTTRRIPPSRDGVGGIGSDGGGGDFAVLDDIQKAFAESEDGHEKQQQQQQQPGEEELPDGQQQEEAPASFFDGEILSGYSNYTYRLSVGGGRRSVATGGKDDGMSLFVKVALSYAVWNPDPTAKFDLQRLSNEMYMMKYMGYVIRRLEQAKMKQRKRTLDGKGNEGTDNDNDNDNKRNDPVYGYLLDVDEFDFRSTGILGNADGTGTTGNEEGEDVDSAVFVPACQPYFILDLDDTARCLVNHFEAGSVTWERYFINYCDATDRNDMAIKMKNAMKFMALINLQPISTSAPYDPVGSLGNGNTAGSLSQLPYGPFHPNFNDGIREPFIKLGPIFKQLFALLIMPDNKVAPSTPSGKSETIPPSPPLPDVKNIVRSIFTSKDRQVASIKTTPYNRHFIDYARNDVGQEKFDRIVDKMMEFYCHRNVVLHGDFHVINILVPESPPTAFRVCDWDMSHVGDYGRDIGAFFAFPIACAYFLASQPGRKDDAYALLELHSLAWNEYAQYMSTNYNNNNKKKNTRGENNNNGSNEHEEHFHDVDSYLATIYRSAMGWFGMYALCANVLLHLQMDHFPFDRISEELGAMVMSSFALCGLKALDVGFVQEPTQDLQSMRKWFDDTVSEQIEFLSSQISSS